MRIISVTDRLVAGWKDEAASVTASQTGRYGLTALVQFLWCRSLYGTVAKADTPGFWFAMQLAMISGFVPSLAANWLLVKVGVKGAAVSALISA